ncbi:urea ABC transporter permease subunit UrtC [Flammeovirga sp. SJP92]|uniref:urea ABC transporter permease subunit UrtC n=1 Tax=Flammeovirga sp. SJP92 TaxID=1775430 RepID=UPI000787ACFC|nr:urea ABC transporter permease subunit UrtC [Flammeovirga sp. SJP92]KXX71509.1 urea ABC transporter permease subunit UrtC [Flammeovirga sp. SJP92]
MKTLIQKKYHLVFIGLFLILMPLGNLLGFVETNTMTLWGRYFCFAIAAIGIDLIWGYTGVLSMTQAFFFCLGAYGIGMYMTLSNLPEGHQLPAFMEWNQVTELPTFWAPFSSFPLAFILSLLVPALFSLIFGFFVFRSRIQGVYFAIITQALALAMFLLFSRNETMLGGTNGLTDFKYLLGFDLRETSTKLGLYFLSFIVLCLIYIYSSFLTKSKFGKGLVAIRDSESRMRFTGYGVSAYKITIFMIGSVIAAIGGMLYLPQTGIITPGRMDVQASIEMIVWVALGGRGNLKGAVLGAIVVNLLYSIFTSILPGGWLYVLGGLFVITVLYLDKGMIGLFQQIQAYIKTFFASDKNNKEAEDVENEVINVSA